MAPRCQRQVTPGCGTGALAKPTIPSGSQPSSRLPLKSRTGRAGRWWQGECGARRPKSEPKLGAGLAGAQLVPGEPCHAAEQLCKPVCWCKLVCWCKSMHQCNPAAAPAEDAAPALLLLCAPPHPKHPQHGYHPSAGHANAGSQVSTHVVVIKRCAFLPSSFPLSLPSMVPIRAHGSALLLSWDQATSPEKQGFLGHPPQGQPRQQGLLKKLPLKTSNPHQGQKHPQLSWEGKLSESTIGKVNPGPLTAP